MHAISDLIPKLIVIIMLALLPVACMKSMAKQAEADYQKCLSWQADGHPIKCDVEKYR